MTSRNMESEKSIGFESITNGLGPKVVETIAKALVDQEEETKRIQGDTVRVAKWSVPASETIVEREIREQRERENALASQRAAAALLRKEAVKNKILRDQNDLRNEKSVKVSHRKEISESAILPTIGGTPFNLGLNNVSYQDQHKIVEDTDGGHKDHTRMTPDLLRSIQNDKVISVEALSNDLSYSCSTKDSWQSESSQSVDTSHSGIRDIDSPVPSQNAEINSNSIHELHSNRSIMVKPLSEPEDDASNYIRWQKETPIEREIRLAREREEELRREKGLPPLSTNNVVSSVRKSEVQKTTNLRNTSLNDCRSVQHRVATSRIQQEINETTEREKELHAAGLIQTISEDTVDSKVTRFTDLAGYAIEERERKLRRAVSTSSVAAEPENQSPVTSPTVNGQKTSTLRPLFESSPIHSNNNTFTASKKPPSRVGHKGVMQRFFASRGKVGPVSAYSQPNPFTSVSYSPAISPLVSSIDIGQKNDTTQIEVLDDSPRKNSRRGYLSAEEKIQAELQEMQKREEELRLQRAKIFAQSQPNLLSIGDLEDSDSIHDNEEMKGSSIFGNSDSSSYLDNSKDSNGDSSVPELSHWNSRKKNSLIAQWESRIQQNLQSESDA